MKRKSWFHVHARRCKKSKQVGEMYLEELSSGLAACALPDSSETKVFSEMPGLLEIFTHLVVVAQPGGSQVLLGSVAKV